MADTTYRMYEAECLARYAASLMTLDELNLCIALLTYLAGD